ncbi:hypothetical protein VSH64_44945 [Amycolatopsis rhabdoformis]|uniref:PrsW family intramembrane metalloprotease n=1 Tax=Amycolatopsis rhabdoformis TaxID=1448059 RepID=A0ABZ1I658_9PSEU|nr:hypothetical protein [Amycolatopsis rhabdoformis]WSE29865.1 hypothetical protein VSH64_44945 [Amycolatopsis rhabdoformis]
MTGRPGRAGGGTAQAAPPHPAISRRERHRRADPHGPGTPWWSRQPGLGVAGLVPVLVVAVLIGIGAGGAEPSLLVLAPLVTFALPMVSMIAFWWEDWPGTRLGPDWSGWADTALIVAGGIVFALFGQAVVGHASFGAIFDPTPDNVELSTFPVTMPLAGAAFVVMLELTLVSEHWPLRLWLKPIPAGLCAVVISWAVSILLYVVLLGGTPFRGGGQGLVDPGKFGAALTFIGAWQVLLFVMWRGWPFNLVGRQWVRFVCANVGTIGAGLLTYVILGDGFGLAVPTLTAIAGDFVAAGLVVGMLFEDALPARWPAWLERTVSLLLTLVLGAVLHVLLLALANSLHWDRGTPIDWVGHATLNALGVSVILHVAIGRRWPFARKN